MGLHVAAEYARDMWQECLDDCMGNEAQAKLIYERIMQTLERHQANKTSVARASSQNAGRQAKRARHNSCQSEPDTSASADSFEADSVSSNSDSESIISTSYAEESDNEKKSRPKLKWCKPGALSRQLGVGLSILRTWAKANLVQTIVSSGGHRLFNVQSVVQHIEQAKTSSSTPRRKELQASDSANKKFQLVAYVCMNVSNRNEAQLEAVGEQIKHQVIQHYKISEDNCFLVVELQTDAKRAEQSSTVRAIQITDTPGIRLLLTKISSRSCSKVVLRRAEDISSTPSTYAFFLLLCQSMGTSVEIVPELFRHTSQ